MLQNCNRNSYRPTSIICNASLKLHTRIIGLLYSPFSNGSSVTNAKDSYKLNAVPSHLHCTSNIDISRRPCPPREGSNAPRADSDYMSTVWSHPWNKLPPSLRVPCQSATSECSIFVERIKQQRKLIKHQKK